MTWSQMDAQAQIRLTVNGEPQTLPSGMMIGAYLEEKGVNPHRVVCELNERVIRRSELDQTELKDGDALEIITMMGGG